MINRQTIDRIFEASRVEEVVADFVSLKKRGTNMIGLCPFHNEKTPSFYVSPTKGIYKCFGCGKAGNSVNFIMEHEQLNYPEALKWLAAKYNIEIEEEDRNPQEEIERKKQDEQRESLYVVCSFAQKHFTHNLNNTDEGKSVALSYFVERGFRKDIIDKFQLGYSPDAWRDLTDAALKNGFKLEYLEKAGLTIVKKEEGPSAKAQDGKSEEGKNGEQATETLNTQHSTRNTEQKFFDRFKGRVIFPVHNVTGRVIAFGGRTLKTDAKLAKYINSPETEIYHKSNVLYGLYFSKKAIIQEDVCFLVEGYTDVISLHQAGIENVVASSGTSLTVEQIRAINRYTKNITILYDGDPAGIKASFRGIDLILEEGMNVRVLLFPNGDDPDSYSKKVSGDELKEFIKNNTKDFISFKTELLIEEVKGDPIKKAALIKDIVESIALIPEGITRAVYVKECSRIMDLEEMTLMSELNRIRRKRYDDRRQKEQSDIPPPETETLVKTISEKPVFLHSSEYQERELLRIMLTYPQAPFMITQKEDEVELKEMTVVSYLHNEILHDDISFENNTYNKIFQEFHACFQQNITPTLEHFTHHPDQEIATNAINLVTSAYTLHDWTKHDIFVNSDELHLNETVEKTLNSIRLSHIEKLRGELQKQIKEESDDDNKEIILDKLRQVEEAKKHISAILGRVVLK
jgi:DNA primase